jgi:hypothetical protein
MDLRTAACQRAGAVRVRSSRRFWFNRDVNDPPSTVLRTSSGSNRSWSGRRPIRFGSPTPRQAVDEIIWPRASCGAAATGAAARQGRRLPRPNASPVAAAASGGTSPATTTVRWPAVCGVEGLEVASRATLPLLVPIPVPCGSGEPARFAIAIDAGRRLRRRQSFWRSRSGLHSGNVGRSVTSASNGSASHGHTGRSTTADASNSSWCQRVRTRRRRQCQRRARAAPSSSIADVRWPAGCLPDRRRCPRARRR